MKTKPIAKAKVTVRNRRSGRSVALKELEVFIDTGSSMSILRNDVSPALKRAGEFESAPAKIITASGEKEATALKQSSLCVESVCYQGDILVSDNIPGHVLIGSDFLLSAKCKVDFKRNRLDCKNLSIPFEMR